MSEDKRLNPEQARFVDKVRRLMMIGSLTTFIALALVIGVIGYRVFHAKESVHEPEVTAYLPKGARITSTAIVGDKIVVTMEVGATTEIRTFDVQTLRSTGRLRLAPEP